MKKLIIAALAALIPCMGMAQETQKISGKITTLKNFPIQNMKIKSMKTGNETVSNTLGCFDIDACDKDVLSISCEPFKNVNQKIKLSTALRDSVKINMTFPRKAMLLNQIIENGYLDKVYEKEAMMALTFQKDWSKYTDIHQAIQVEFPSLRVGSTGCYQLPGNTDVTGDGCMLTVLGSRAVSTIDDIPISNVEDIYILKGAQATVWGVQGANGVLVIKIKNDDSDLDTRGM